MDKQQKGLENGLKNLDAVNLYFSKKLKVYSYLISDVLNKINNRKNIEKNSIIKLEQLQSSINTQLFRLDFWSNHKIPEPMGLRNTLEQEFVSVEEMKIKVKENSERDVAILERELRELLKEYHDLKISMKII